MLKGCQKKMIEVRGGDRSVFETAYFILRRESDARGVPETDMLMEANRIINENHLPRRKRRGSRLWAAILFGGGCLCGSGGTLILMHFFGG